MKKRATREESPAFVLRERMRRDASRARRFPTVPAPR